MIDAQWFFVLLIIYNFSLGNLVELEEGEGKGTKSDPPCAVKNKR